MIGRNPKKLSIIIHILQIILTTAIGLKPQSSKTIVYPSQEEASESALLSSVVYSARSCESPKLPSHVICRNYFSTNNLQSMVVYSRKKKYIAVVYAGTDELMDWTNNLDVTYSSFGPIGEPIAKNVLVHAGFNQATFSEGAFDNTLESVRPLLELYPNYRFFLTGHSLGGAQSLLAGTAFANLMPQRQVTVLNYGCPRFGNSAWKVYSEGFDNLNVWRFVYADDPVPRLFSKLRFAHSGHTVQLDEDYAAAYYYHVGDLSLGYAGVPLSWKLQPFPEIVKSVDSHSMKFYKEYIDEKSEQDRAIFYVADFVAAGTNPTFRHGKNETGSNTYTGFRIWSRS